MPRRKPLKLKNWLEQSRQPQERTQVVVDEPDYQVVLPLHNRLHENIDRLRETLGRSADIMFRNLRLADGREACLLYVEGLSDPKMIETELLQPLTDTSKAPDPPRFLTLHELSKPTEVAGQHTRVQYDR